MLQHKQEIKLIALDIDGTLITSDHKVSKATETAVFKAVEKGVHVLLCTGRPPNMCSEFTELLQLNTYLVTASGGEVWSSNNELLERHLHDSAEIETLWKIGKNIGLNMWIISTNEVFENGAYPEDFHAHEWLKIGFFSDDKDKLHKMQAELSQYENIEITNSHPSNIEVNPGGVSKAHALKRICKDLDITMNEVMAVGDSLNDFTMIKEAGIGVAMGNAQDLIKEIADYITDTNDQDGVAKAIEKFVL